MTAFEKLVAQVKEMRRWNRYAIRSRVRRAKVDKQ